LKRLKVKDAKKQSTETVKGLMINQNNMQNEKNESVSMDYTKIRRNSFDNLMENMLILDRSIFEYKFIFAKNLEGKRFRKS
jgi:hypothetical protein